MERSRNYVVTLPVLFPDPCLSFSLYGENGKEGILQEDEGFYLRQGEYMIPNAVEILNVSLVRRGQVNENGSSIHPPSE